MNTETTPAGTTQTPDQDAFDGAILYLRQNSRSRIMNEIADMMEEMWRALAASKAREAELVKALEDAKPLALAFAAYYSSCGCYMENKDHFHPKHKEILEKIDAALTAPPTNSKEMNK